MDSEKNFKAQLQNILSEVSLMAKSAAYILDPFYFVNSNAEELQMLVFKSEY